MTEVRAVTIGAAQDRSRVDTALAALMPDLSRSRLKKLITDGHVAETTGDKRRTVTDPSERVKSGQNLTVSVPAPEPAVPQPQAIPLDVVFEDAHVIVVNKPAGLVVHPAAGNPDRTLVNALLAHCGDSLAGIGGVARPGIVHRLDKDTSGLMIAAKTDAAHASLTDQFAAHSIDRAYQAIVWGAPRPAKGKIEGNIGRSPTNRQKMAVVTRAGKHAVTRYETVRPLGPDAAEVICRLETGRTHQIRVHLSHIGHPLVGDRTYGRARKLPKTAAKQENGAIIERFPRQALNAFRLGFRHPATSELHVFEAPMPEDMATLANALDSL